MSSVTIHIEQQDPRDRDTPLTCTVGGEPVLSDPRSCVPKLSATHNGLTRSVWIRRTIEDLLHGREVSIADGASLGKKGGARTMLFFYGGHDVSNPGLIFEKHEIPWMPAAMSVDSIGLIGMSGKMACPTWDLPAGSPLVGGSCHGATPGQTIIPLRTRSKINVQAPPGDFESPLLTDKPDFSAGPIGQPVRISETICQLCYATGGNYMSPHVQVGEVVRYWWTKMLMATPEGQEEWIQTVVRAIHGEAWKSEAQIDPRTGGQIYPMRVHSSGDFFSKAYARCWLEVANRVPEVTFWAPTRTWAIPGWMGDNGIWANLLRDPGIQNGNFAIRPSAYHTGDPTPSPQDYPWQGAFLFPTTGTTSIYAFDDATPPEACGRSRDPRYDWACQAYAVLDSEKTCRDALAPNGEIGCRACWLHPELRVNYTTH